MRIFSVVVGVVVLVASGVGIVKGHVGSGVIYGGLALFGLVSAGLRARRGNQPPQGWGLFAGLLVPNVLLVLLVSWCVVDAVTTSDKHRRGGDIAMAVIVGNFTVFLVALTVYLFRRIRKTQNESETATGFNDAYDELYQHGLEEQAKREESNPYPDTPRRRRAQRWWWGIAAVGFVLMELTRAAAHGGDSDSPLVIVLEFTSLLMVAGGALGGFWSSVWVFKDHNSATRPSAPPQSEPRAKWPGQ